MSDDVDEITEKGERLLDKHGDDLEAINERLVDALESANDGQQKRTPTDAIALKRVEEAHHMATALLERDDDADPTPPGVYLVNATGEMSALATEDGSGDRLLLAEVLDEHDVDVEALGEA